jgi:nucleoside-diphosphate-sugar epimerase
MAMHKILIAGASGLVGHAAVRHFTQLKDWDVVAVSRRTPMAVADATFVSVDLLDPHRCNEVFSQMSDVTHLVYAAVNEKAGLLEGWLDREQMRTNLAMLENLFEPLQKAARDLRHVTLLQGTKAYGVHFAPIPIPARERAPRHPHENFYWLQEDYLRAQQAGKRWSWTILRPQLVVGEAIGSNLNVIPAIGVYAAIRKEAGLPLAYPGGPSFIFEMVDADLLARSMEWAATTSACRNETFNITNGDVFVWRELWPTVADALGMKTGPDEPCSLAQEMPSHAAEWAGIVRKYNLAAPADIHEFVGESFSIADFSFGYGAKNPQPAIVSTTKAR